MINRRNHFTRTKMARQYRVSVNFMLSGAFETNVSIEQLNERRAIVFTPGPPPREINWHIPITDVEDVIDLNIATIRLELLRPLDSHVDITFGSPASKDEFHRLIRADSDGEDSGVSSGTPSPPAFVNDQ